MATPSLEQIWAELRPHVEWADGFNLILLFANHPQPVETLRQRLDDSLQLNTQRLRCLAPDSPEALAGLIPDLLQGFPKAGPVWVELWRYGEETAWCKARNHLLHELNEHRSQLAQSLKRPLLLVLPSTEWSKVFPEAPDLWVIRAYTAQLPAPLVEIQKPPETRPAEAIARFNPAPSPAELEWARLWQADAGQLRLNIWDGVEAFDSAMERGDLPAAETIARQTLQLARHQCESQDDAPLVQRNLSVALDEVGKIEEALGNLETARAAYRESLTLFQQLRQSLGDTPQALRDLSVSLNNVGNVEAALGNLEAARAADRESLTLAQQLRQSLGDTPQALRDLSVSLDNVGEVEDALGNLEAARAAYRESLTLRQQLRHSLGDTPQALRDLSVALNKVGGVEADLGNLEAARAAYRDSLTLRQQLRQSLGDTPQTLRDLSISLYKVGAIEEALGNREAAREAAAECLELSHRLRQTFPDHTSLRQDGELFEQRWRDLLQQSP